MGKPLWNMLFSPTSDRTKPRAGSGPSSISPDRRWNVVVPFCARIQLAGGQKVNRGGTHRVAIPWEWLLIEFA
ncbi:hypothetical protein [Bradyrhizobium sp. Gha]|uniref:hypothetical protein n=1 Tax=Bradyrhizobium sp. Gha TaxID=1855318 RepID=UPI001160D426|nr:hypothetical protein [Bradyrhizobium sp. Gha]